MAYHVGRLNSGVPRQDVVNDLLSYDEARRTEVARWFQSDLGWETPMAILKVDPGVVYFAGLIDSGVSDDVVHAQILASGLAVGQNDSEFVADVYQITLGREPDPDGLAYFTGQLNQGSSRFTVALAILGSFEGHRTEVARFYQTELGWQTPLDSLKLDSGVWYWAGLLGGT